MFSKNPKRVAERQLNKAELDLLEVCEHLESYESNKRTLEQRIARLRAYVNSDADQPEQVDERTTAQRIRDVANSRKIPAVATY
jgi:hypothetical protein